MSYEGLVHTPVMLAEVLNYLQPKQGGVYVDGTFGAGGYSSAILETASCKVFGVDRDPGVQIFANALHQKHPADFKLLEGNFGEMEALLSEQNISSVDGIVLDIGVSSMQLEAPDRGFSFQLDGPLDMRMDKQGSDAAYIVNSFAEKDIANILFTFGGERESRHIAHAIVKARAEKPITRTLELADIIKSAVRHGKHTINPATKSFQAIRIYINRELEALQYALEAAERLLTPTGKLVIVSFHELEDAAVKSFLSDRSGKKTGGTSRHLPQTAEDTRKPTFKLLSSKAVLPSENEVRTNPRARSAKLRAAERTYAEVEAA
jgi:16S rRNA (cytosine1402-N4)-methyltransferase